MADPWRRPSYARQDSDVQLSHINPNAGSSSDHKSPTGEYSGDRKAKDGGFVQETETGLPNYDSESLNRTYTHQEGEIVSTATDLVSGRKSSRNDYC